MRHVNITLLAAAFILYIIAFGRESIYAALFFAPFTMTPFAVNGFLAYRWRTIAGQSLLLCTTLAYAGWFAFVYIDVVHLHPDAQGAIAFLFVGIYAAPVLLVLWLLGWALEGRQHAPTTDHS